jgi:hypothetical protein
MTNGREDGSSGSDSEPSADNLDEEEMAQVIPIKYIPKKPKRPMIVLSPPNKINEPTSPINELVK